jgi:hypothetical protein
MEKLGIAERELRAAQSELEQAQLAVFSQTNRFNQMLAKTLEVFDSADRCIIFATCIFVIMHVLQCDSAIS